MTELSITHTHAEGTLITGTTRGDGSAEILKNQRWRWGRSIGCWYIPRSRDTPAKRTVINATVTALEAAGFAVTVEVDNTPRPTAEVEADKLDRAQDRADALAAKAQRKDTAAATAWQRSQAAGEALPPGGEPIKVGHHSEGRHRRSIDKAWNAMGKAVEAEKTAQEAHRRAEAAAATVAHHHSPHQVATKITEAQTRIRAINRRLDGYTADRGTPYATEIPAATGPARDQALSDLTHAQQDLDYWQQIRTEHIATGATANYTREDIKPGDLIRYRRNWAKVARVNPKTVTIWHDESRKVTSDSRISYTAITDHKPATD